MDIEAANAQTPSTSPSGIEATSFPRSLYYIIGNEFCERFSFYGMKAILPVYLATWIGMREQTATSTIHAFVFSAYFTSLFGAMLSDGFLGKYWTILSLSIVYCFGSVAMAVGAWFAPGTVWSGVFLASDLGLIAVGTGGIKPCVSSFGGDQLAHFANAAVLLTAFFSAFYFAVNAGSVVSMWLTPILREDIKCFGRDSCYPLAFGLPAILMLVAVVVFFAGRRAYKRIELEEEPKSSSSAVASQRNVIARVFGASLLALERSILARSSHPLNAGASWIKRAMPDYEEAFLEDVGRFLRILGLFLPIAAFWALFDQQGSRWTFQAMRMSGSMPRIGTFTWSIKPEQMGLVNAILILVFIPLFDRLLYPLFRPKVANSGTDASVGDARRVARFALGKMIAGMLIAVVSFLVAAFVEFRINAAAAASRDAIHLLWQTPQYILITVAEILVSITGLEFAYAQAPKSMRSVCSASWLLTVALGNLLVLIVTEADPLSWFGATKEMESVGNFVLWAGVLTFATLLFTGMACNYVRNLTATAPS